MKNKSIGLAALVSALLVTTAQAECTKTLMGSDCATSGEGVATHMRGNAVENAKASKALQAAKRKAKAKAMAVGQSGKETHRN